MYKNKNNKPDVAKNDEFEMCKYCDAGVDYHVCIDCEMDISKKECEINEGMCSTCLWLLDK